MADTGRRTYRRRHSALGVASLVLSVCSSAAFLLLVWLAGFLERVSGLRAGELDAPGMGLLAIFVVLAFLISTLAALALAAAALMRPGRGWLLPAVAWMAGASVFAYAGAQEAKTVPTPVGVRYLVPEGEYVFQVTARRPEGVDPSWVVAQYHFRVRLEADGPRDSSS